MTVELEYYLREDKVVMKSPVTGDKHSFSLEEFEDFLDWLTTDRKNRERWGVFWCHHEYGSGDEVIGCELGTGQHRTVFRFSEDDASRFFDMLSRRVSCTVDKMIKPLRDMVESGVPVEEAVSSVESMYVNYLPVIWKRPEKVGD
ncbi:MAG: hypothetical protein ACOC5M_00280 [Chloroflexota bacterium]